MCDMWYDYHSKSLHVYTLQWCVLNVSIAIKNLDHYVISVLKAEIPICRAVVSGGAKGALAPPEFRSSVIPIPTRGGRLRPPHYY